MMTSRWVVRTYCFSDDKWWLILSSTALFVYPFFEWLEMQKKRFTFAWKNNNFILYFVVFVRKKKFAFCLVLKKEKSNTATFFICFFFFFCFPNDDKWWQVGRWCGITNLVMTWWLGWVVVTKCRNADDVILKWSLED